LIFPGEKEPEGMVIGFRTFCEKHQLNNEIIPNFDTKTIEKGAVFVIPSDLHLVQVIEQGKSQQLNLGTDYGIISFNDMPLKKVVENGITTISTDFKKMGTTLAKMVLSNEKKQIENPSDLIIRNSL
jgi:DNA-binding LacI/PurR family transcriptional regulator